MGTWGEGRIWLCEAEGVFCLSASMATYSAIIGPDGRQSSTESFFDTNFCEGAVYAMLPQSPKSDDGIRLGRGSTGNLAPKK